MKAAFEIRGLSAKYRKDFICGHLFLLLLGDGRESIRALLEEERYAVSGISASSWRAELYVFSAQSSASR
jgi:hypothetical protein